MCVSSVKSFQLTLRILKRARTHTRVYTANCCFRFDRRSIYYNMTIRDTMGVQYGGARVPDHAYSCFASVRTAGRGDVLYLRGFLLVTNYRQKDDVSLPLQVL